jgi:hypothetical protein
MAKNRHDIHLAHKFLEGSFEMRRCVNEKQEMVTEGQREARQRVRTPKQTACICVVI